MAFLRDHHYIRHPDHGWLTPEFVAQHPEDCECRLDLQALGFGKNFGTIGVEPDRTNPYEPERGWPHHVEKDLSTGLTGYTRCSEEEMAVREWIALLQQIHLGLVNRQLREEEAARLQIIREKAAQDPAFAALAKQLRIPT